MANSDANVPDISIILPVFNVAEYLGDCLDSILEQEFSGTSEIILVEDCSTDNSLETCQAYASEHPGLITLLVNESNQGVSISRNRGLKNSRGRYFMFIDPDDLIPPGSLQNLFDAAQQYGVAIVKGNNTIFDERTETEASYNSADTRAVAGDEVLVTLFEHRYVRGHPWGKLFRAEKQRHFRFPEGVKMAQDLYYCCEVFNAADSLLLLNQNVYRYRNRSSGSTGRKYEIGSYLDWLDSVDKAGGFATTNRQRKSHKNLLVRTMTQIARECRKISPEFAREVLKTIEQRCRQWDIRFSYLLFKDRLGPRSLGRYLKLKLALAKIRQNLSMS